jgi:hypothetical protein
MFRILIEFDKDSIITSSATFLKQGIQFLYKWLTTDGEALGYILGHIHFMLFVLLLICVVLSHTLYPNFWFQFVIFCVITIVWLQHIFLKVCVSIVAEKDLTQKNSPFHDILETVFGISTNDFTTYFIVAETAGLACLALELISKICINFISEV